MIGDIDYVEYINRERIAEDRNWHKENQTDCEDCGGRATRIFVMCFWGWHVCEECYNNRAAFKSPVRFAPSGMIVGKQDASWEIVDGKVKYKEARA